MRAYRRARARSAASAMVEREIFHALLGDLQESGCSVREISTLMGLPKSTVSRWRLEGVPGDVAPIVGATEDEWLAAWNSAWAHDPGNHLDRAPFTVEHGEDASSVVS